MVQNSFKMAIGKRLGLSELVCAFSRRLQPFPKADRSSSCAVIFIFYFEGAPKVLRALDTPSNTPSRLPPGLTADAAPTPRTPALLETLLRIAIMLILVCYNFMT
jgi:hypothetical protein